MSVHVSKLAAQKNKSSSPKPGGKPGGNVQAKPAEIRLHALEKNTSILPASMNPAALSSSIQNDIPIPQNLIGHILGMTLAFTCSNSTNANIVFPSFGAVDMISSIDQLLDGTRTAFVKHIKETLLF